MFFPRIHRATGNFFLQRMFYYFIFPLYSSQSIAKSPQTAMRPSKAFKRKADLRQKLLRRFRIFVERIVHTADPLYIAGIFTAHGFGHSVSV